MKKKGHRLVWVAAGSALTAVCLYLVLRPIAHRYFQQQTCFSTLCCLQYACVIYAADHNGAYPTRWSDCTLYAGKDCLPVLVCPATKNWQMTASNMDVRNGYNLIPGRATTDREDNVLAYEPLHNHGGRGGNVMFVNGAVKWLTAKEYVNLKTN